MDITNPRRILAVSSADSVQHLARVLKDLTGTIPEQTSTSLAGTSHNLSLQTTYYKAEVPIWLDLISSPSEWSASFLSVEAKEVLEVLGGVMVVFALPVNAHSDEGNAAQDLIKQVGKVVKDGLGGWEWDGVGLCLGVGEIDDVDLWEDCCAESGLEFVQVRSQSTPSRNEFGEKTGIPRALEALEAHDWANASADDLGSDFEDIEAELEGRKKRQGADGEDSEAADLDPESLDFGRTGRNSRTGGEKPAAAAAAAAAAADGAKQAEDETEESLDEDGVQKIERLMAKLQTVRETNAGLPEDQRKRAAAKAVAEVMREI
ncbi:hypothetical protein EKO27_g11431 [Xylaria grammica]|uniref:Alpha and gamma adaptin binding protein p34 n=1 Tax=Xylaria grammica TaxID=363999 RepID=A0A439CNE1_9PEZI|nr:hypothetical protein EKO27_g11431 [Xylaria grammica]